MLRNMSIRTKILAWVLIVNLIGAVAVAVYLHQTFSGGLDVAGRHNLELSKGAWEDMTTHGGTKLTFAEYAKNANSLVARLKKITGAEYGLLLAKDGGDAKGYAAARKAQKLPNNWDEGETYAVAGITSDAFTARMQMKAAPDAVPEIGKIVGIENGACSKTCHGTVKGSGDFWGVTWSSDSSSRAHAVLPIVDGAGKPIGLLYTIDDITEQANADRTSLIRTLLVIMFGLACATFLISFLLNMLVFKRLKDMIESMEDLGERVAGGDFSAHFTPDGMNDEIGRFQEFFAKFLDLMSSIMKSMMSKSA